MRIFSLKNFVGEWTNENWKFRVFENGELTINWRTKKLEANGTSHVYENFLIFHYNSDLQQGQWTARIDKLEKNNLVLTDITNKIGQVETFKQTYSVADLIRQFEFDKLDNLTIDELKNKLDLSQLSLNKVTTKNGEPTEYYRHWDYEDRFAVILDQHLLQEIKNNRNLPLEIEKTLAKGELGYYTKFVITRFEEPLIDYEIDDSEEYGDYDDEPFIYGDPSNDSGENPWIDVFGEGEEADTAYWNTD